MRKVNEQEPAELITSGQVPHSLVELMERFCLEATLEQAESGVRSNLLSDTAAENDGYDFYLDNHSVFAGKLHTAMKLMNYHAFYLVSLDKKDIFEEYKSYAQADDYRKNRIKAVCHQGNIFLSSTLPQDTADAYQKQLAALLSPILDEIQALCIPKGKEQLCADLSRVLADFPNYIRRALREELEAAPSDYHLYDLSYFVEITDVVKHDYRTEKDGLLGILEALIGDSIYYQCNGITDAIREMDGDVQRLSDTFCHCAKEAFAAYAKEVEKLLEQLGETLPPMLSHENIREYFQRLRDT